MRKMSTLALAIALFALPQHVASAAELPSEEPAAAPEPPQEEYRTVITPRRASGTEFDVDRSVYLRDEQRLRELAPTDVPDVLDDVPGVQVQRTNRGAGAPVLRGFIGPQNLILIDGVRYNNSTFRTGPNQYLSLVDPAALSGVEVVLGPGSVLYGSDAMGGTINLLPLDVPRVDGPWALSRGRFASVDLGAEVSLLAGGKSDLVSGWAGGGYRNHGILRTGDGTELPLSDYEQGDWRGRLEVDLGKGWSIGTTYLATRLEHAGRTDQVGTGDVRFYDNGDDFVMLDARYASKAFLRELRLDLSYHRTSETVRRYDCETDADGIVADLDACLSLSDLTVTRKRLYDDTVDTVGGLAVATGALFEDRLTLTLGTETYADFVGSTRKDGKAPGFAFEPKDRGNFSDGSTYLTTGAFLYSEGRPLVVPEIGDLVLSAGVRVSHTKAHAPSVPDLGDVDYEHTGVVASAGARFLLMNRLNVYANFSQGFRAPNLQETTVLGDTGSTFEVPNADLGPERSNTIEAGVKFYHPWIRFSGAFFYSMVDDVIDREDTTLGGESQVDGKQVVRRVNAAEGTYEGVEAAFETGRVVGISAFANVSWVKGDVKGKDGVEEPARRVPPVQGLGGFRYRGLSDRLGVELFVRWAAAQDRLNPEDERDARICGDPANPGKLLADCDGSEAWASPGIRVRYDVTEQIRLDGALENLLDARYRVLGSGFDAPGLNASVALTVEM